jgi:hypothetical protein
MDDSVHQRPLAGAFLARFIQDHIDDGLAGAGITLAQDLAGDLDEITF